MNPLALNGKRVLLTQANHFMGPALREVFSELGAEVIADESALDHPERPDALIKEAGRVDVLLANLGIPAPSTPAADVADDEWRSAFAHMVDPLQRLVSAVLPQMIARGSGKIILIGSASALRGIRRASTYSAARGAQVSYVRAVGAEVAPHKVRVNLIAQNFVENPMYYGPEVQALPAFQERLKREVPAGRLASAHEDALFAVFLASSEVDFFVGQSIPFAGGWVS